MKKKLLALVLVLAIAPIASAAYMPALDILVNGDPYTGQDVEGSDIITLIFYDAGDMAYPGSFSVFEMAVSNGDYMEGTFDYYLPTGMLGGSLDVLAPVEDGLKVFGNALYGPATDWPEGQILYDVEFHVPYDLEVSTMINIDFSGAYGAVAVEPLGVALHVIPEPMTIVLLGLGGLFLRRRK